MSVKKRAFFKGRLVGERRQLELGIVRRPGGHTQGDAFDVLSHASRQDTRPRRHVHTTLCARAARHAARVLARAEQGAARRPGGGQLHRGQALSGAVCGPRVRLCGEHRQAAALLRRRQARRLRELLQRQASAQVGPGQQRVPDLHLRSLPRRGVRRLLTSLHIRHTSTTRV